VHWTKSAMNAFRKSIKTFLSIPGFSPHGLIWPSVEESGRGAVQLHFRASNAGSPSDPPGKISSAREPLAFVSKEPVKGDPTPELSPEDGFDPVPNFFKAILWSFLLFVAIPAGLIFGVYWLIWR
jgi:hypothetical protein